MDILLGRFAACCFHPCAAWRRLTKAERSLLVVAYAGAGYVTALLALLTLR